MPKGFFDTASTHLVTEFRDAIVTDRREELMEGFPEVVLAETLQKTWQSSATTIYGNWLHYVLSKKADLPKVPAVVTVHENFKQKRSILG